jgi:hypothetical protein
MKTRRSRKFDPAGTDDEKNESLKKIGRRFFQIDGRTVRCGNRRCSTVSVKHLPILNQDRYLLCAEAAYFTGQDILIYGDAFPAFDP